MFFVKQSLSPSPKNETAFGAHGGENFVCEGGKDVIGCFDSRAALESLQQIQQGTTLAVKKIKNLLLQVITRPRRELSG